jgi:hypothetical protein
MRTITEISDIKEATNGNSYVNLTFAACIEDGVLLPGVVRAFFADSALIKQIKVGMKMEVEPI